MYPLELEPTPLVPPPADDYSIVLITGGQLRHRRFALRLQQTFPGQVIAWFELDRSAPRQGSSAGGKRGGHRNWASLWQMSRSLLVGDRLARLRRRWQDRRAQSRLQSYYAAQAQAEQRLFAAEVAGLEVYAVVPAQPIHPSEVNEPPFITRMRALDPYFLLTLGGPLYRPALLQTVRGLAINQHAGHSPDLRGSNTTEWALYHRDLDRASATVHLTTQGADAGPILRRSQPCLFPGDDANTVFARVVALGTELMIEVVQEIMAGEAIRQFPQPPQSGRTHLGAELDDILAPILRDFEQGWLPAELQRQRQF